LVHALGLNIKKYLEGVHRTCCHLHKHLQLVLAL